MNFPSELKYTIDHEWIKIEGDIAHVGITDFAQRELGDIVFVDINTLGSDINKEGIFGAIEAVKTVSDLFMPITGTVLEVNPLIDSKPELVNSDPYGDGWLIKIKASNLDEVASLLSSAQYQLLVGV